MLDVGCWMVMFKDGSGNDAWYMYMTNCRRAAKSSSLNQTYQSTIRRATMMAVYDLTQICRRMRWTLGTLNDTSVYAHGTQGLVLGLHLHNATIAYGT